MGKSKHHTKYYAIYEKQNPQTTPCFLLCFIFKRTPTSYLSRARRSSAHLTESSSLPFQSGCREALLLPTSCGGATGGRKGEVPSQGHTAGRGRPFHPRQGGRTPQSQLLTALPPMVLEKPDVGSGIRPCLAKKKKAALSSSQLCSPSPHICPQAIGHSPPFSSHTASGVDIQMSSRL